MDLRGYERDREATVNRLNEPSSHPQSSQRKPEYSKRVCVWYIKATTHPDKSAVLTIW